MRFVLFGALYVSVGMASAQSAGYGISGAILGCTVAVLLVALMHFTFGVFGEKQ